jgi:hypothetical protein
MPFFRSLVDATLITLLLASLAAAQFRPKRYVSDHAETWAQSRSAGERQHQLDAVA